jgi:transcriptional regulator with XRE-family HTH domain
MPFRVGPDVTPLIGRARVALGLTQKQLGEMFHTSMRTAHRWEGGKAYPDVEQIQRLVRAVFPVDAQLAAQLAHEAGTELSAMGLVVASNDEPAAAPSPPSRPFPPVALMIDSILLAAVDAAQGDTGAATGRQTVRDILRAAFSRARGLGLTIEEVEQALAPPEVIRTPARR